MELGTLDTENK